MEKYFLIDDKNKLKRLAFNGKTENSYKKSEDWILDVMPHYARSFAYIEKKENVYFIDIFSNKYYIDLTIKKNESYYYLNVIKIDKKDEESNIEIKLLTEYPIYLYNNQINPIDELSNKISEYLSKDLDFNFDFKYIIEQMENSDFDYKNK